MNHVWENAIMAPWQLDHLSLELTAQYLGVLGDLRTFLKFSFQAIHKWGLHLIHIWEEPLLPRRVRIK